MITRRRFVATALAATTSGIVAGIAAARAMRPGPSVRFIGRIDSMIALLDTAGERVLIVLGERDDDLLASIPGLKLAGSRRVDLVIASHAVLASRAAREHLDLDHVTALCLQSSASLPPIRGKVLPAASSTSLTLGNTTNVSVRLRPTSLVPGSSARPAFVIAVTMADTRLVFADNGDSLRLADSAPVHLIAVPGEIAESDLRTPNAALLVTTQADQHAERAALHVTSTNPVVVQVRDGAIEVQEHQLLS